MERGKGLTINSSFGASVLVYSIMLQNPPERKAPNR